MPQHSSVAVHGEEPSGTSSCPSSDAAWAPTQKPFLKGARGQPSLRIPGATEWPGGGPKPSKMFHGHVGAGHGGYWTLRCRRAGRSSTAHSYFIFKVYK